MPDSENIDKKEENKNDKPQNSQSDLEKCQKEKGEYLNGWQRAKADFENYKKEEAARAEAIVKFANASLLFDLINIMDSFDLAVDSEKDNKGLVLIRSQFESFLGKNGLTPIKSLGEKFNPALHESVAEKESDQPSGIIIEEIERGWLLYEKVIRPARVKIAK